MAKQLLEASRHDHSAGVVKDEVQTVAVKTQLGVHIVHRRKLHGLRVRAARRDKKSSVIFSTIPFTY